MPEISVIVPVYKVEPYLHQCVDSILAQTFRDFELILVDDGSPDGCPAICDEYAQKDPRVRVIHKENGGLSSARNAGIDAAQGNYLSFIGSDDWIDPEMLQQLYWAVQNTAAQIAACDVLLYQQELDSPTILDRLFPDEILSPEQALGKLRTGRQWKYVIACNKLYDRQLFEGLRYPEGYIHEDEFLIHRLYAKCDKIVTVNAKLYIYRQRGGSITHGNGDIKKTDVLSALADRILCAQEAGFPRLLQNSVAAYVGNFFELYFRFHRTKENEKYFIRMDNSLKMVLPNIRKCKQVSTRHKIYLTMIRYCPGLYRKLRAIKR